MCGSLRNAVEYIRITIETNTSAESENTNIPPATELLHGVHLQAGFESKRRKTGEIIVVEFGKAVKR